MCPDDLGEFIRQRRESVSPAEVGLPIGPRRRTPGLRRAELATLAGISVDYLVRLEQGRDRRPSAQVLAAIADALRLGEEDRAHLDELESATTGLYLSTRVRVSTLEGEQLAWTYALAAYEGGLPSASYLGLLVHAAEAAGAPDDYVASLRARACRSTGL